jgi:hypothetical protein
MQKAVGLYTRGTVPGMQSPHTCAVMICGQRRAQIVNSLNLLN